MKLNVRHSYPCDVESFWKLYWSDAFEEKLKTGSGVTRELISEERQGDLVVRRVRITPDRELPGAAAKILGSKKLVYEQETKFDEAKGEMTWRVLPTILPGKLKAEGMMRVQASDDGCIQSVTGDINVSVPFIGGKIEKEVVSQVSKSYDNQSVALRELMDDGSRFA